MGLFDALIEVASMPIRCAGQVVEDLTDGDDADTCLAFFTLGASSVVKGVGKTIQKACDKLED